MLIFDTQIGAQRCGVGYYALSLTSENRALLNFSPDLTRGSRTLVKKVTERSPILLVAEKYITLSANAGTPAKKVSPASVFSPVFT